MDRSECVVCDTLLVGKQKKYCSAKCKKRSAREQWVKRVYGISLEQYDQILDYQGGRCPICGRHPRPGETFVIDHEHGAHVRGVVCRYCNRNIIGRLKDYRIARNLADYLRDPPAVQVVGYVQAPGRPRRKRRRRNR